MEKKTPKLLIASNGKCTAVVIDGVYMGKGIRELRFEASEDSNTLDILSIDVAHVEAETDRETIQKKLRELME